jgi:hypothetical protein
MGGLKLPAVYYDRVYVELYVRLQLS